MGKGFTSVLIEKKALAKIKKHKLEKAYKKSKEFLLSGDFELVDFKKRRPYKSAKYYFRLNKQYRAICYKKTDCLYVFEIDNHQ